MSKPTIYGMELNYIIPGEGYYLMFGYHDYEDTFNVNTTKENRRNLSYDQAIEYIHKRNLKEATITIGRVTPVESYGSYDIRILVSCTTPDGKWMLANTGEDDMETMGTEARYAGGVWCSKYTNMIFNTHEELKYAMQIIDRLGLLW